MEIKKLWEIVWHRKWIIIQAFLVISLTAIIGSNFIPPIYESSAKVLIKTSDSSSSLLSSIGLTDLSSLLKTSDEEVDTYIELAILNPVLEEVISKLQLKSAEGILMSPAGLLDSPFLASFWKANPHIEVHEVRSNVNLIRIAATSPNWKEPAMIANTLADVFIEQDKIRRREEYRGGRKFIDDQIKIAKTDYVNVMEELKQYKIAEKTINIKIETEKAIDKMAELMKEKEDNIIDIIENKARIQTLKQQLKKGSEKFVPSSAISKNPQIGVLKKALIELEVNLAAELTDKTKEHPDVIVLKQRIKKIKANLRTEMKIYQSSSVELEALERDNAALKGHLNGVNADIVKYMSLLQSIPNKVFVQSQLELKLSAAQELYSSLLEYLYEVGVAEAMMLSNIKLVEPAAVSNSHSPKSPNKRLIGIIGVLLGLLFGFGLAFLIDYLDDTIKSPEEIKEFTEYTYLGAIQKLKGKDDLVLISDKNPKDPLWESYRTLRNSIKFSSLDRPIKSFVITSSLAGEGKSTNLINLGISFANADQEVLLIDTDLHKPKIHKYLNLNNNTGITNLLTGKTNIENIIQKTNIIGLDVVTSGPIPPDPGRIIETNKMEKLIQQLILQYDIVIFDSPPVLVANDSIVLAGYTDGYILIIESQRVTRKILSHVQEKLNRSKYKSIGAILNKVKIRKSEYYYYYNSYYYKDSTK